MKDRSRRMIFGALTVMVLGGSGCIHRQVAAAAPPPPLDVPLPPARVVEASSGGEVPQPVGLIGGPTPAVPVRPRPAPQPAPRQEPPKVEAAKPADVQSPEAAKPDEPRQPPATPLRTTPTQQEAETEARVRGLLTRATSDLQRIDYRNLGANARTQYETAKGFIKQAEDAIKEKNLPFASSLADKAAALAAQLAGR